jgi:UDP-glucose 4-epimerase
MGTSVRPAAILVTGARGYLGGRLIRHLADRGRAVRGTSRTDNPPPVGWPAAVPLTKLDPLGDPGAAAAALAGIGTVIHLAAANEGRSASEPDAALAETGAGTRRLIEAAVAAGVGRFVFLSTIHVYGTPLRGLLSETDALRPIHPYAITHQVGEAFTLAARDAGRIEAAVVRLSNAIGAPAWIDVDRWTLLGNDLARQAVATGEIVVRTPGQWRDFITLRDVCAGLERIADAPVELLRDGVVNLGTGTTYRVDDMAERLARVAEREIGRPIALRVPGGRDDVSPNPPFALSIDRLRALGFTPSGFDDLDDELGATIRLLDGRV